MVLLYAAETGSVAYLPAYIRNSLEMLSGYSEGMSIGGPLSQVLLAIISVVVLFLGLPLMEGSIRTLAPGFLSAAIYAFLSFKAGMVRQDAHASNVELNLALAALFLLVFVQRKRSFYFVLCFQVACLLFSYHYISEDRSTTDQIISARLTLQGSLSALKSSCSGQIMGVSGSSKPSQPAAATRRLTLQATIDKPVGVCRGMWRE
jgi:hypothetical protein